MIFAREQRAWHTVPLCLQGLLWFMWVGFSIDLRFRGFVTWCWYGAIVLLAVSLGLLFRWWLSRYPWMSGFSLVLAGVALGLTLGSPDTSERLLTAAVPNGTDRRLADIESLVRLPDYLAALCWVLAGFLHAEWLYHSERRADRNTGVFAWILLLVYILILGYCYITVHPLLPIVILATPAFFSAILFALGVNSLLSGNA